MAKTAEAARNLAIAFWDDENAKKVAMAERGRKLGLARLKNPQLLDPEYGGCREYDDKSLEARQCSPRH